MKLLQDLIPSFGMSNHCLSFFLSYVFLSLPSGFSLSCVASYAVLFHSLLFVCFSLIVESQDKESGTVLFASLNLVDLAGSESVRHTGASGQRAKEGGMINQSLLSLSRVIQALSQPGNGHINYRDSKLTRLLQPSLSGNAKMAIICCITPAKGKFHM
jgi:hypothetical protein